LMAQIAEGRLTYADRKSAKNEPSEPISQAA